MANEIVKNDIHVFKSSHPTAALDEMIINDHNKTAKFTFRGDPFRGDPTEADMLLMGKMLQMGAGKQQEQVLPFTQANKMLDE